MRNDLTDGHVIGFLLDSRLGDLKKSGFILHPDAVVPLDDLLGQRATLFYPDPRRFAGKAYLEAVRDFSQKLLFAVTNGGRPRGRDHQPAACIGHAP